MTPTDSVVTPPWALPASLTVSADTVRQLSPADSLRLKARADSLRASTLTEGILISAPEPVSPSMRTDDPGSISWVIAALCLLFCIVALRFRNNGRYLSSLLSDLVEVRERQNVFDDTVRETSFLVLLNILWCFSVGVLLWGVLVVTGAAPANLPAAPGMAVCAGVAVIYELFMTGAYSLTGNVFRDRVQAGMWIRGFLASQALMSIPFLFIAMLSMTMPEWLPQLLIAAACTLVISKLLFIWKGFRIFFAGISSWVLFLYYLCSLEIIPLILTYVAASAICVYFM